MCRVLFSSKLKPAELLLFFFKASTKHGETRLPGILASLCSGFSSLELRMLSFGVVVFQQASLLASQ